MKSQIITGLKLGCLVFITTTGFLFTYSAIWILMGLQETWWAAVLLTILSGLSTAGLFCWIAKGD